MKDLNFLFLLTLLILSLAVMHCRNIQTQKTKQSMMDLQIQALKKKTLSNKLNFYAKQEKEKYLNQHPEIKTKKTPVSSTNAKLPAFNFFALFKDTPEKLLDFPFSSSFSQISSAQESTNRHYVLSTIPLSLNTLVRRKKLQHHEETVPLFSRI